MMTCCVLSYACAPTSIMAMRSCHANYISPITPMEPVSSFCTFAGLRSHTWSVGKVIVYWTHWCIYFQVATQYVCDLTLDYYFRYLFQRGVGDWREICLQNHLPFVFRNHCCDVLFTCEKHSSTDPSPSLLDFVRISYLVCAVTFTAIGWQAQFHRNLAPLPTWWSCAYREGGL